MAASIFGLKLAKRARLECHSSAASGPDGRVDSHDELAQSLSFEDREDLLNDLLEDDATTFPLLSCPAEVLHAILVMLPVTETVRMRVTCHMKCTTIDAHAGLWCSLLVRDFADLGGMTKHYRGLRMTADAWKNNKAVGRLEWDPLLICAPPALRYALLTAADARRKFWDEHGHALGAGWAWFSTKVCRRMATSTFVRWASLQFGEASVRSLLAGQPENCQMTTACQSDGGARGDDDRNSPDGDSSMEFLPTVRFRCGRSDAVLLSAEAAADIYETVQRWHGAEHRENMRAHIKGTGNENPSNGRLNSDGASSATSAASTVPVSFSVTPTLDVAESLALAAAENAAAEAAAMAAATDGDGNGGADAPGAASHRLEEAQLRLALEMSREEAERVRAPVTSSEQAASAAPASLQQVNPSDADTEQPKPVQRIPMRDRTPINKIPSNICESEKQTTPAKLEPEGLVLKTEGAMPDVVVFLKEHCLAAKVDDLPLNFSRSIDHIVSKMMKASWGLLYESVTEEIGFRAKSAAHALLASNATAIDRRDGECLLEQERMCLPIWRSSTLCNSVMTGLSKLRHASSTPELRMARCNLIRQASLEWCELEDFTAFLDEQLGQLELAIDSERGLHEMTGYAHTPHVRDMGRLMFRNCCLLDSRIFRPLCLAAYALVHDINEAASPRESEERLELMESLHVMLAGCDVADDHLSASQDTKDVFAEHLLVPITAALEHYRPWDIRGADPGTVECGSGERGRIGRQRYKHSQMR